LENQLVNLPLGAQQARQELTQLARTYEQVRRDMPPGNKRTVKMASIAVSMMALAKKTRYAAGEVIQLFQKGGDGDRLPGIEQVHGNPDPACFQAIEEAIRNPRSSFEQYRALLVAQDLLARLDNEQKQQLADALKYQRSGAEGTIMNSKDRTRFDLGGRILSALGQG